MKALHFALAVIAVAAVSVLNAGDTAKGGDKFDPAKLVGTWKYVSGIKDGAMIDADHFKEQEVIIAKEKLTLKGPEGTFVIKYELDTKKSPIAVKMEITESPFGACMKADGILELKGDELRLCY